MKSQIAISGLVIAIVAALVGSVFAEQAPMKRNFEAEIQKALE